MTFIRAARGGFFLDKLQSICIQHLGDNTTSITVSLSDEFVELSETELERLYKIISWNLEKPLVDIRDKFWGQYNDD